MKVNAPSGARPGLTIVGNREKRAGLESDVESKLDHVAVLHFVFLSLDPKLAGFLGGLEGTEFLEDLV